MNLFAEGMLFKTITVPHDIDHSGMVQKPVENDGGDNGIAKEFLPVDEALVRGDDRRALFIAARDELEEEIGLPAFHGSVRFFV
jgi:hypothetical protein